MYPYILFTAFFQAPAPPARVPLLEDCSEHSRVIALLDPAESVHVHSSISGDTATCYAVSASVGTQTVDGHVLGVGLAAVREFERQRKELLSAPPPPTTALAPKQESPRLPAFRDFSGMDIKDRRLNFSGINGKLVLVCFWSPRDQESERELIVVTRLYNHLHRQGLEAVGVSLDLRRSEVLGSMEDFGVAFPTIADSYGLAKREGLSADSLPYTFILDRQHGILGAGLHGRELETTVQMLMSKQ